MYRSTCSSPRHYLEVSGQGVTPPSVVQWSEFLATVAEVPGSIPGATKFSAVSVCLEWGPLSLVRINEELLERKSSGSGLENSD
jgi:hypothetical protein